MNHRKYILVINIQKIKNILCVNKTFKGIVTNSVKASEVPVLAVKREEHETFCEFFFLHG